MYKSLMGFLSNLNQCVCVKLYGHSFKASLRGVCEKILGEMRWGYDIISGSAGINFSGGIRDMRKKEFLEALPITIFAIHGNHERRPQTIERYQQKVWHGGVVYW